MQDYTVYRLRFKTQLHLGRATGAAQTGSLGLEKTETYISADTLFSAICQTWSTFYDTECLTDFLNQYKAENDALPFTLTSAFPYADNIIFFPRPLTWKDSTKESKRVQFVSKSIFQEIVSGNELPFDEKQLINSDKVWISPDEKTQLKEKKAKKLNIETPKVKDEDIDIWKTATRPRVSIDRQTDESSIWHVQTVQFNTDCGLWFAAKYDSDETKQKVETLLRVLGDNGIGGERNAGYGQFEITPAEGDLPKVEDSTHFVTLSPICPKCPEQLEHLLNGDIAYNLSPITGWVGTAGTHIQRKKIHMFTEGSVLNAYDERVGRLVDLKRKGCTHPVYRYGFAWQIGIKGASK